MKNVTYTFLLFIVCSINNLHAQIAISSIELEPLAENTIHSEFGVTPYLDGYIFASNFKDLKSASHYNLYYKNNKTNRVTLFSAILDTQLNQSSVVFTSDKSRVFFTSNLTPSDKFKKRSKETITLKLFTAEFVNGRYKNIKSLPFNSNEYNVAFPAISPDGKKLYFSSDMPGGFGSSDIYVVDIKDDNKYSKPKNLGSKLNTKGRDNYPFVSNDNILYFSSDGRKGYGGLDVYKYDLAFDSEVMLLNKGVNSEKDDFAFSVLENNETAFVSTNRYKDERNDEILKIKFNYSNSSPNLELEKDISFKNSKTEVAVK